MRCCIMNRSDFRTGVTMLGFIREFQTDFMLFFQGICLIIAFLSLFTKSLSVRRRNAIILLEVYAAVYLAASRFYYLYKDYEDPIFWPLVRSAKFLDYFFALAILLCFNLYLKDLFKNEAGLKHNPKIIYAGDIILVAGIIVLAIVHHTGFYYYFDANNIYTHGPGFFVQYFFAVPPLLIAMYCVLRHYRKFPRAIRIPIVLFLLIPVIMAVLQLVTKGIAFAVLSTAGMDIVLYVFTILDMNKRVERAHRLEIEMMAKYQKELEETVALRTAELRDANEKVEHLLLNILPENVARELTEDPNKTISQRYPNATVLFTDVVDFTRISDTMSAEETVSMLNNLMTLFDERSRKEGIEKIKTIGDAYMAAAGLTEEKDNGGAEKMIRFAQGLLSDIEEFNKTSSVKLKIRIGINSGELVAGVIGKTKFIYDVWGDTVNVASRMESSGTAMKIHVSEATYEQTKDIFPYSDKAKMDIKGKGSMTTYYL